MHIDTQMHVYHLELPSFCSFIVKKSFAVYSIMFGLWNGWKWGKIKFKYVRNSQEHEIKNIVYKIVHFIQLLSFFHTRKKYVANLNRNMRIFANQTKSFPCNTKQMFSFVFSSCILLLITSIIQTLVITVYYVHWDITIYKHRLILVPYVLLTITYRDACIFWSSGNITHTSCEPLYDFRRENVHCWDRTEYYHSD